MTIPGADEKFVKQIFSYITEQQKLSKPPSNNHLFELILHVCLSQLPVMKRMLELFFMLNIINKTHDNRLVVKSFLAKI